MSSVEQEAEIERRHEQEAEIKRHEQESETKRRQIKRRHRRTMPDPATCGAMSVLQAADYLGISLTKIYAELGNGNLKYRKSGRRTLVRRIDADQWLENLPDTGLTSYGRQRKAKPEPAE
jgi:excisionase family DNA binding protein